MTDAIEKKSKKLSGTTGGLGILMTVVLIILGVMIWRQFPVSAVWLVGVLVGIRLIFAGWTMILLASVGESVIDTAEKTEES